MRAVSRSNRVSAALLLGAAVALVGVGAAACTSFEGAEGRPDGSTDGGGIDVARDGAVGSEAADAAPPPICDGCRVVFVTSASNGSDGNLGGLDGADAKCMAAVAKSSHPSVKSRVFKAWLSASAVTAASRLVHGPTPYVRVDNMTVANDWSELTSGKLKLPINIDETGAALLKAAEVWTGTKSDGLSSGNTCGDWSKNDADGGAGQIGSTERTDVAWTDADLLLGARPCGNTARLYCVEQLIAPQ